MNASAWQMISAVLVASITVGLPTYVQIRKLDRRNTAQHDEGKDERHQSQREILGRIDEVHLDVITANLNMGQAIGKVDGKLTAHIQDRAAHDRVLMAHGDAEWAIEAPGDSSRS